MSVTPLKQQLLNYTSVFKQLFMDYYTHQKKLFWLVQVLIAISTLAGIFWMLSIILGISHYQNPSNTEGIKHLLFAWIFKLPLWQWLLLASISGLLSAWTLYLSIQTGVTSVLDYQKYLSLKCIKLVSQKKYRHWTQEFDLPPKMVLLRLLRQGVQLTGLVARRITRAFISLVIFIVALFVLVFLDGQLLLLLVPIVIIYIIALYYINRYAARISTQAAEILVSANSKFSALIADVLNRNCDVNSKQFQGRFDDSQFMLQAELKYKRRLAEIHVGWLNSASLVIGVAIIIIYIRYIQDSVKIDWQALLFFLIALRYAASSLQQVSATTVAFSRFLPEIQLVYRLLNVVQSKQNNQTKIDITSHTFIYINSSSLEMFEKEQLLLNINIDNKSQLYTIADVREKGMVNFFQKLTDTEQNVILIDNKLKRLKQIINQHIGQVADFIVIVFSSSQEEIKILSIGEFLRYETPVDCFDSDVEIDPFE